MTDFSDDLKNIYGGAADQPAADSSFSNDLKSIYGDQPYEDQSSWLGTAARSLERNIVPGLGGAAAGFYTGAAFGGYGAIPGTIAGFVGGTIAGYGLQTAQNYAIKQAPQSWQDALGFNEDQEKIDEREHPYASFIGGMLPFAITMKPGGFAKPEGYENLTGFQKLLVDPVTSRLFSGAVVGGVELGQELVGGDGPDWTKVATATGFGLVLNKANTLGQKIEKFGARLGGARPYVPDVEREPIPQPDTEGLFHVPPGVEDHTIDENLTTPFSEESSDLFGGGFFHSEDTMLAREDARVSNRAGIPTPNTNPYEQIYDAHLKQLDHDYIDAPSILDSGDFNVMGIGSNEETHRGSEARNEEVKTTAQAAKQAELATFGPIQHDIELKARATHPELFSEYDQLVAQRQELHEQIAKLNNPPLEDIQAAHAKANEIEAQLNAIVAEKQGYTGGKQARQLRAQLRNAQATAQDLLDRSRAYQTGEAEETPELAALREAHQAIDYRLRDVGKGMAAARQEVQPEPVNPNLTLYQPSLLTQAVAGLKAKYTIVDGKIKEMLPALQRATDRTADNQGVNVNQITLDQNRQSLFNYFKAQAQSAGRPAPEASAWADVIARGYMTRAARMGYYAPHGISVAGPEDVSTPIEGLTLNQPGFLPGFYSAVQHAVLTSKQERASGPQWINQIRNTGGVKPEEVEWLGLDKWLQGLGKVSKKEVMDYISANNLELKEQYRGNINTADEFAEYEHVKLPGGDPGSYREILLQLPQEGRSFQSYHWDSPDVLAHIRFDTRTEPNIEAVKKATAVLDEAEKVDKAADAKQHEMIMGLSKYAKGEKVPTEVIHALEEVYEESKQKHTLFKEAAAALEQAKRDGKKTLMLHEIQSDWHQQGKKKGYIDPEALEKANKAVDDAIASRREAGIREHQLIMELANDSSPEAITRVKQATEEYKQSAIAVQTAQDTYIRQQKTKIPDAPFKTSWPELALKRMIRYAADNNFEKISFPGDAQTVARIENWHDLTNVDGRWKIHSGKIDVTPIIERYTKELPKLVEKLGKKYGVNVEKTEQETKGRSVLEALHETLSDKKPTEKATLNTFNVTPELRQAAQEKGFPLFQRSAANEPRARVTIDPKSGQKVIELFRRADASSLIHEGGHIFLENLRQDAAHPNAPQQIRDDYQTVLDWFGVKTLDGLSHEELTKHHERFARGFEQYLLDGKAPSPGLARAFEMFKEWLTQIYGTLVRRGETVPPQIKEVFDRLLATDEEIARARPQIEPEGHATPTLFDIHSGLAATTDPHEAEATEASVTAGRNDAIAHPPREITNEIETALHDSSGETGSGAERLRAVDGSGDKTGDESGRGQLGTGGGQVRQSVSGSTQQSRTESVGPRSNPIAPTAARTYQGTTGSRFVDGKGNFSLKDVRSFGDLQELMHDMQGNTGISEQPVTPGMLLDLSNAMGLDRVNSELGRGLNAQDIVKAQAILGQASLDVVASRKSFIENATPEAAIEYEKTLQRMKMIMGKYAQQRTEWGRSGHALQQIYKHWSKEAGNIEEATGLSFNQLLAEAKLGSEMVDQFGNAKWVRDTRKPEFGKMILEFFTNNVLSGPATHFTYFIAGQILSAHNALIEQPVAALIGQIRQGFDPGRERVYAGEAIASLQEYIRSLPKATQAMIEGVRSGQQILQPGQGPRPLPTWRKLSKGEIPSSAEMRLTVDALAKTIASQDVRWGEVQADLYSLFRGMKDGIVSNAKLLDAGGQWGTQQSQLGYIPDVKAFGATIPVGSAVRLPSRAIAALHSFQYTQNYSIKINAWAFRQATNEGLKPRTTEHSARTGELRQNPTAAAMDNSSTRAYELSMLGESGELVKNLQKVFNWAPELPFLGQTPILKFIDPFIHIASNVVNQSIVHRTPLGLLSRQIRKDLAGEIPEGATPTQKAQIQIDQDSALARMIVGSTIAMTFGGLASQGLMSGSGPADPSKRAVWEASGNRAHSLRIGDMNYSLNRLGSLGMLASISADMYSVAHLASKGDMLLAAQTLHHAVTQNLLDESFIRGPADFIQAVEEPERYGERYIQNFATSFIPASSFLTQENKAIDPYTRQARTVVDAIRAKIPWISQELAPRRDIWGEPIPNPDALIGKGLTAIYESRMSQDPVNIALSKLDAGIAAVPKSIRNVQLTDQEYDDFQKYAGRLLKTRLNAIVISPYWKQLDPQMQRRTVQEFIKQSREVARGIMFGRYPHIPADATRAKQNMFKEDDE